MLQTFSQNLDCFLRQAYSHSRRCSFSSPTQTWVFVFSYKELLLDLPFPPSLPGFSNSISERLYQEAKAEIINQVEGGYYSLWQRAPESDGKASLEDKTALPVPQNGQELLEALTTSYGFSPVGAEILLSKVEEWLKVGQERSDRKDNQIIYRAVSDLEPAGKALRECRLVPVSLDYVAEEDKEGFDQDSPVVWKRVRRLSQQAQKQGGCLNQADLALILGVSVDLVRSLRKEHKEVLPIRSNVVDIGPGITHVREVELVKENVFLEPASLLHTALIQETLFLQHIREADSMLAEERRANILRMLKSQNVVQVKNLADHFDISPGSIRRDLDILEKRGLLIKTYGGAMLPQGTTNEPPYILQETEMIAEKKRIGSKAAGLIEPGDTVFIDTGTTALQVAMHIGGRKVTVLTNSLKVAAALEDVDNAEVIVTGGHFRRLTASLLGPIAERTLKESRVNKAFIGATAIDINRGMMTGSLEEAQVKRLAIESALQVIVVADHTKLNRQAFAFIAPNEAIDTLVVDNNLEPSLRKALTEKDIEVIEC